MKRSQVALWSMGCRLNTSEADTIAQNFIDQGHEIVDFEKPADIVFLNTCTVTENADATCRNLIRKAQKTSPQAKIIVAGCYSQMFAEEIKKIKGVDLILGSSEKFNVLEYLDQLTLNEITKQEFPITKTELTKEFKASSTVGLHHQTRAFLKIQDGCDYVCSFCIIPFARGRSRASSINDILIEAKRIITLGHKEIVLTGVNIGEYENKSGEKLTTLLEKLNELNGLERLRISSIEPNTITPELIKTLKNCDKILPHFHVPLQSGSNKILKLMRRKYLIEDYKEKILSLTDLYPNAGIGADIIVGFPDETEEDYHETFQILNELPIAHFHVFPYSRRKGTTATKNAHHVPYATKKIRVSQLRELGDLKLKKFAQEQEGKVFNVLFEKDGEGYTENYLRIKINENSIGTERSQYDKIDLSNKILPVKLLKGLGNENWGELIN
jgi:threonylcarbamoyladenosine tRNA methylthiotransferase MtaB